MSSVRLSVPKGKKGFTTFSLHKRGFTLIELLVVISIIAILSVVGFTSFTNVTKGAKDAKRRADIDSIAKAYEVKYNNDEGKYTPLATSSFASGTMPEDPTKGTYRNWLASDKSGFIVCAALEANKEVACVAPAPNCYCKASTQGILNPSSGPYNPSTDPSPPPGIINYSQSATHTDLGPGSTSPAPSCDPDGSLLSELVGYWKMDEGSWSGSGAIKDSSGYGNNGSVSGGARTDDSDLSAVGFVRAGFMPTDDVSYVKIPVLSGSMLNLGTSDFTISSWVKSSPPGFSTSYNVYGSAFFGNYPHGSSEMGEWVVYVDGNAAMDIARDLSLAHRNAATSRQFSINYTTACGGTSCYNRWTHIVYTKAGDTLYLYINGTENKNWPLTGFNFNINFPTNPGGWHSQGILIGDPEWSPGIMSNLRVDDLRIYKKALSPQKVSALYNGGNGCIYQ